MTDDRDDEMLRSPDEQEERENADMANTDCMWLGDFLKAETIPVRCWQNISANSVPERAEVKLC